MIYLIFTVEYFHVMQMQMKAFHIDIVLRDTTTPKGPLT